MNRPTREVADIVRQAGPDYIERHRSELAWPHLKALQAIQHCRTAALGGHLDACSQCGHQAISYNSCRNRHGPKCQTSAREQWLAARSGERLPVAYDHVVFTRPGALSALVLQNKRLLYNLLFRTSAETLLAVAADPKHLGARIGFLSVRHSWGQRLDHPPHVPCVVPGGGVSQAGGEWKNPPRHGFFLPVRVLSRVFRGKFMAGLKRLFRRRQLPFHGALRHWSEEKLFRRFLRSLFQSDWVVYAKKPFGGPEHVLQYLARYTHRVAISNHRLLSFAEGQVTFRWKDDQHGNKHRPMTLSTDEFLRRFLLPVLPRAFVRIRHFGFLAHRQRGEHLALCRQLLTCQRQISSPPDSGARAGNRCRPCPRCAGVMKIIERLTAQQRAFRHADRQSFLATS
jgi:Putative transposase/Transposase zinc-binding domain